MTPPVSFSQTYNSSRDHYQYRANHASTPKEREATCTPAPTKEGRGLMNEITSEMLSVGWEVLREQR